jgi:ankyrin repeat protein
MVAEAYDWQQYSIHSYALLQAAAQSDIDMVMACLSNGAYVDATDAQGRTALLLACARGQLRASR